MNNKDNKTNRRMMRDDSDGKPGLSEKITIHTLHASGINTNGVSPINEVVVWGKT